MAVIWDFLKRYSFDCLSLTIPAKLFWKLVLFQSRYPLFSDYSTAVQVLYFHLVCLRLTLT